MIGQKSAEALLSHFNNEPIEQKVVDVGFELVVRQTT
jgi:DNA-binding LacI/PurR family transcriptional regulator